MKLNVTFRLTALLIHMQEVSDSVHNLESRSPDGGLFGFLSIPPGISLVESSYGTSAASFSILSSLLFTDHVII